MQRVLAVAALQVQRRGLGRQRRRADDDARDAHEARHVRGAEVADGDVRGGRVQQQLVLGQEDVGARRVDDALGADLDGFLEL